MTATIEGKVVRFTQAPTGEVDGFVLDEGSTVHFPPFLGKRAAELMPVNARVRAVGLVISGPGTTKIQLLEASEVTNVSTNQTLRIDSPPGSTESMSGAGGAAGAGAAGGAGGGAAGGGAGGAGAAGANR